MRYRVLACDYDGTIATAGRVDPDTVAALQRLVASGRKLVLVTGRRLEELLGIFPEVELFERVVAENGALIYRPDTRHEHVLAEPFAEAFVPTLRARGVHPLAVGRVIVATWEPHEVAVLRTIRDLGLELQVIFNKGAVMILPGGITKATGLAAALREMGYSPHNTVAVGDAENDHAFMSVCAFSCAVANALPAVQERADLVTRADHGAGVAELIERMLADDLADLAPRLTRHHLFLGQRADGGEFRVAPQGGMLLLACSASAGLPAVAACFLRRLDEAGYQHCWIDAASLPEGAEHDVVLGTAARAPTGDEIMQALSAPERSVAVFLAAIAPAARPAFVRSLLGRIRQMRREVSRPHWIVVNPAHELLTESAPEWSAPGDLLGEGMLLVSADPGAIAPDLRAAISTALVAQPELLTAVDGRGDWAEVLEASPGPDSLLVWRRDEGPPFSITVAEPSSPAPVG